ncbi:MULTISPECIES: SurA N-terminal domain-containing protein [Cysteiniphilum]|uniref:Peptidylprolyl isomerase n=1 Tax=Cysteiniphilum litorale TaxID=2056700 RepID=A0A8J2Z4D4_9GAMM|nr:MULTISPECIES: SurA N-terminal domain-containing protein [Cysteiniphilum]GGF97509.1 peptidylprolyl isomerase [Cysteiniphilum litorale]
MLQSINDKFKGWITWIIIIAVSAVFVLTGISYFFVSGGVSPQSVAKVGDVQISQNSYQQSLSQNMQAQPSLDQKALQEKTLNQLVDQALLQQDATASHIAITQSAVSIAIFQNPAFVENGQYSAKRFDELAKLYGGAGNIKALIANSLLTSSIVTPLLQSEFVLSDEQKTLSALMGQKREVTYYDFAAKDYASKIKPTDKELQAYYDEHKVQYEQIEQAVVSYVKLSSQDFVSKEPVSESEINSYYQANKDALMSPELRSGETITIDKKAKDSKAIAEKLKANQALTADELKEVKIEQIKPLSQADASGFAQFALFNLTLESPVKETSDNEFVKLTKIIAPAEMSLSEAKPVIEKILKNRAALTKFNEVLTSINSNSFDQVVKANKLTPATTNAFDKNTTSANVEGNAKLQEAVFDHNKTQGFIAQGQTDGIIYKVDKMIPKHTLSFAEVKDKVKTAYIATESLAQAQKAAQDALKALQDKKEVKTVKAKTETISRSDFTLDQDLKTAIFSDGLKSYKLAQNGESYWVYEVAKVIDGTDELPTQVLQNNYSNIELNDYLAALKKQYKVEINHQLIQ